MKSLYRLLFDKPELIFSSLHTDDAFPSAYKKGYGKPELDAYVSKINNTIQKLLRNLFVLGQGADVKLNQRELLILSALGIDNLTKLPTAWVWLSTRPEATQTAFTYCLFRRDYVYSVDVYARLVGEEAFRRLERWMNANGYKPYDTMYITGSNCKFSLTYANPAWGNDQPKGGNQYKIKHTGISARHDAYVRNPTTVGLCIPYGMKRFLENFDIMSQKVKNFVVEHTKKCDGCRYCIQTDKTVSRSLACISVTHKKKYNLCPYFPGYNYSWARLDDSLVDNIIEFLAFMDKFANESAQ